MKQTFADLGHGNVSFVISAAGGLEYALEDNKYHNGVFTYAIKKGLLDGEADIDKNGEITITELKDYVSNLVVKLTGGRQKPTSRRETIGIDWRIW
jgi:hypothetical protein